jgi:hypothetical protein
MISNKQTSRFDTRALLSTLWIVVMLNLMKADLLSLYIPGILDELVRFAGGTPIPQIMLIAAIVGEVFFAMIILSRVLPYRVNRWANIVTSILAIVYIIGGGSLYPHYLFIATVEVACLVLIAWTAWRWPNPTLAQ